MNITNSFEFEVSRISRTEFSLEKNYVDFNIARVTDRTNKFELL